MAQILHLEIRPAARFLRDHSMRLDGANLHPEICAQAGSCAIAQSVGRLGTAC